MVNPPLADERRAWLNARFGERLEVVGSIDGLPIEQAKELLPRARVVIGMRWPEGLPDTPRLDLLQLIGAGYDGIRFDRVPERAAVCNVYEHEIGISEYLLLAMLEWEIRLGAQNAALHQGRWVDGFALDRPPHGELYGRTVGLVGYGRIARETARRLRAFGVTVMARTRSPERCDELVDDAGDMSDLVTLLAASDYVVLTTPLTAVTRGLVDDAFLAAMRSDAVLINVARGAVVDEGALWRALTDKRIGGAVIDTWYRYPSRADSDTPVYPGNKPFHELDNVVMTPHSSGWSRGLLDRRWRVMAQNLDALLAGEPLVNVLKAAGQAPLPAVLDGA